MGLKELKSKSREQRSYGPFPGTAALELAKFDLLSRTTVQILKELRANFGAATLGCHLSPIITRLSRVAEFPVVGCFENVSEAECDFGARTVVDEYEPREQIAPK